MGLERYLIRVSPRELMVTTLLKLVNERISTANQKLESCENLIKEKLGDEASKTNLPLWIGNSVKSEKKLLQFLEFLKNKGLEESDLKIVESSIREARELLGFS